MAAFTVDTRSDARFPTYAATGRTKAQAIDRLLSCIARLMHMRQDDVYIYKDGPRGNYYFSLAHSRFIHRAVVKKTRVSLFKSYFTASLRSPWALTFHAGFVASLGGRELR